MKPKTLRLFLSSIVACYFLAGVYLGIRGFRGKPEIFPVFSFFLYDQVPNNRVFYKAIIHEYNGEKFDPPISIHKFREYRSDGVYLPTRTPPRVRSIVRLMSQYYINNNQEYFSKFRSMLEEDILNGKVKYELIRLDYKLSVGKYPPKYILDSNQYEIISIVKLQNF